MKSNEKYQNVLSQLKKAEPKLENLGELANDIMRSIREDPGEIRVTEKIFSFFFSWTQNPWLRLSMGTVTFLFLCVFIFQQFTIANRINSIEKQITKTANVPLENNSGIALSQRVLLKFINKAKDEDSITLAKKDLEKLLNSYMELKENHESFQEGNLSPNFRELIKPDQTRRNNNTTNL